MPRRVERDITSLILATSPLKIRSWMSGELSMISIAAMRPAPDSRGIRRCDTSARMLSDRSMSSWSRRSSGKKLIMRSSAWLALLACSVASTRCPVSEIADQEHIGRLTQGVLERRVPGVGVDADLAVRDHAALVGVHVFDRILDGDDVPARLVVSVGDHLGGRGGFARTGAADDDRQPALAEHDLLEDRGQLELLEGRDLGVDQPDDAADRRLLHEGAHAEAPDARRGDCEVAFLGGVEFRGLPVLHDGAHQRRGLLDGERALALRPDFAVDLDRRRETRGNEQVGGLFLRYPPQQVLHQLDGLIAIHVVRLWRNYNESLF